ncbi:hypothetical protein AGABI1DRAFT_134032 [Agaricus bisporus var. burnettii JB137-S8]|uniref:Uncharacterized protein n=1 Tax=Agaricus bisporus var. burnettii (strain JB137-S8 / ATCC MYA-4627 / FGSC 10392) TaxID=597362 RepID=K5WSU3_AGABU|nr:uncharacterized protein AGABI1DRAFT_134032 [Agaricus bisporus var. burnettii JB137-S8]EKM73818.1 hypothetical protein AGABI1DRAFT_134032 [Agaricus bisporus var. burnettii JB137-S8]
MPHARALMAAAFRVVPSALPRQCRAVPMLGCDAEHRSPAIPLESPLKDDSNGYNFMSRGYLVDLLLNFLLFSLLSGSGDGSR